MVVMTLLAILAAAVTPVFRGALSGVRAEDKARDLVAMLEYAQARAITDAVEYRVYIAPTLNSYWLERAQMRRGRAVNFRPVNDAVVERINLPESTQLAEPRAAGQAELEEGPAMALALRVDHPGGRGRGLAAGRAGLAQHDAASGQRHTACDGAPDGAAAHDDDIGCAGHARDYRGTIRAPWPTVTGC